VLEVGARDVNGNARSICVAFSKNYFGVDIENGPGVDAIVDANHLAEKFGADSFDVVISTEMLEHVLDWANVLFQMLTVLKPAGLLVLTTRSVGFPTHDYPSDHWRFTRQDMLAIFAAVGEILEVADDMTLGYPCGIGIVLRKSNVLDLEAWRNMLAQSLELYNVNFTDKITLQAYRSKLPASSVDVPASNVPSLMNNQPFHREELISQFQQAVDALSSKLAEKEKVIQSASTSLTECYNKVESLVTQYVERQDAVESLIAENTKLKRELNEIVSALEDKTRAIDSLAAQLATKDHTIQVLTTLVGEKEQFAQLLAQRAADRDRLALQLDAIYRSKLWKFGVAYRRILEKGLAVINGLRHSPLLEWISVNFKLIDKSNHNEPQKVINEVGTATAVGKVSIIIVTFNNLELTQQCLRSVLADTSWPNFDVIVVDNASTDGTVEYLKSLAEKEPRVSIIFNARNLGFAAANNIGIRKAQDSEFIVLLNNDTVVPRGWLARLIHHARKPEIGIVGPVTNWTGNEAKIDVTYSDIRDMEAFAEAYVAAHQGQVFDIRVMAFYCVAMRKQVIDQVGLLDERFHVGMFEDDDYARRVRLAGYRVICAEDVFVHHHGNASFSKLNSTEYQGLFELNKRLYEEKWGGAWQPHQFRTPPA
jgi:GT2 family glycosyltransferase